MEAASHKYDVLVTTPTSPMRALRSVAAIAIALVGQSPVYPGGQRAKVVRRSDNTIVKEFREPFNADPHSAYHIMMADFIHMSASQFEETWLR
jgi:hypothetical protein